MVNYIMYLYFDPLTDCCIRKKVAHVILVNHRRTWVVRYGVRVWSAEEID